MRRRARGEGGPQRLELLGWRHEQAAQVARALAIAALLADASLLLRGERRRLTEGEATVLHAWSVDVSDALVRESEKRADVRGSLGKLREQRTTFGFPSRLSRGRRSALADSEH